MSTTSTLPPPDGGWGWMVVAGSALPWFFVGGFIRSFSLIHEQLRLRFDASASEAAFVYSLNVSFTMLTAPLAAALSTRLTCRQVSAIGATLLFSGTFLTAFAPSLAVVYVTYGLLAGSGYGLIATVKYVMVASWFRKRIARAMAASLITDGFGVMAMGPLITFLFDYYGFQGAILIISGLILHGMVTPMAFVPPSPAERRRYLSTRKDDENTHGQLQCNKDLENEIMLKELSINEDVEDDDDNSEKAWAVRFKDGACNMKRNSRSDSMKSVSDLEEKQGQELHVHGPPLIKQTPSLDSGLENSDIAKQSSDEQLQLDDINSCELSNMQRQNKIEDNHPPKSGCLDTLYSFIDLRLFRSSLYVTFTLSLTSLSLMASMCNTHVAGMALERSMTIPQVALLLAIAGGLAIAVRLFSGLLFDTPFFRKIRVKALGICCLCSGCIMCVIPFTSGVVIFYVLYLINSTILTTVSTQEAVVLTDIVPRSKYASAVGLSRFFRGIGVLIGPTVGGLLKDVTGSYNTTFYFGGGIFLTTALIYEANLLRRHFGMCTTKTTDEVNHPQT